MGLYSRGFNVYQEKGGYALLMIAARVALKKTVQRLPRKEGSVNLMVVAHVAL